MQNSKNLRIITLSPAATDTVFALGAGENLAGCVLQPRPKDPVYAALEKTGTAAEPDMDKITALRPDMAIVSPGANRKEDIESLASSGVEVILLDGESVAQALRSIKDLGIVLNKRTEAEKLTTKIEYGISTTGESVSSAGVIRTAFFTSSCPYAVAAGRSLAGELLSVNKLENIYRDIDKAEAEIDLSTLKLLDPQLILLPDYPRALTDADAFEMGKYTEHALTVFVPGEMFVPGAGMASIGEFYGRMNEKMRRFTDDNLADRDKPTYF